MSLSNEQYSMLIILMRQAFDKLDAVGLIESTEAEGISTTKRFETWRRDELAKCTLGLRSLKDCQNKHVRHIKAHFLSLVGKDGEALDEHIAADHPDHVTIEQLRNRIEAAMEEHGYNERYLGTILRHRFRNKRLTSLNLDELTQLLSTLHNRGRNKRSREETGEGDPEQRRDKKQRRSRRHKHDAIQVHAHLDPDRSPEFDAAFGTMVEKAYESIQRGDIWRENTDSTGNTL
jgi:hypothetical protein